MPHYEFNTRDYVRILYKRKGLIILAVLIGVVCGYFFYPEPAPVFQSAATVKIEERKTIAGLLSEWIVFNPGDLMASQTKIIKGFPIIKKVALRLGMIDENSHAVDIQKAVSSLQEQINTERIGQTNIIKITGSASNPGDAKNLAYAVSNTYVEENLLEKTKQSRRTRQFIEEQLSILQGRLKDAEDRLKVFQEETGEVAVVKIDFGNIESLQNRITEFQLKLIALEQRYTSKHPNLRRLKEQIENLESQLEDEKEMTVPPKGHSSGQKLDQARLSREVEINKKLYMMFKEKLEEARINEAQKLGDASIVDPAVLPDSPVSTQGNINILLGAIIGLLLGIGLAFIIESVDTSIGTIEDIERVLKLPVLGIVSSAKKDLNKKQLKVIRKTSGVKKREAREMYVRLITHYEPKSLIAESCRNIRTNLKLNPSKKTILVTSSGTQEGKTTILINLGLAVAQTGAKTLLVSSDLRRPAIAKTFGVNREPGLTDFIAGTVPLRDAFRNISDLILSDRKLEEITKSPGLENLWILPCGKLPHNPAEILQSREWDYLVKGLKQEFDFIFFDTPPVLAVTDASIIASGVDSVVMCYEMGRISREALLRAKTQIESVGTHISGIILNQIKSQAQAMEPYPYYTSYRYRYYRESEADGNGFKANLIKRFKDKANLDV